MLDCKTHKKSISVAILPGCRAPHERQRMTVLLSVQDLAKGYGPRPLFTELCLDLRAGERVGLMGPKGSAKTTPLNFRGGREAPGAGTPSPRRSPRLGYVPQDEVFPTGKSVRDVLLAALSADSI